MAGDWIKMRVDLGDDPAVVQIAAQLDISEDDIVGKLHRLWSWADRHTTDGTAPAITQKWVDRYVGAVGFADAMALAGWISFSESGVLFPNFDRHNGDSAKRRGEAAIRQRLSRKNRDEGVTGEPRSVIPRPFIRHVMERDAYTCVYCGKQSSETREASHKALLSVDHIKPITRGGSAAVENLACCCRLCNGEKNDRTPEEWGLMPTFLQDGITYKDGQMITNKSQQKRDEDVTREEKRREEKSNKTPISPDGDLFDRFWKSYPRKVGKDAAQKAFDRRRPTSALVDDMLTAIAKQVQSEQWTQDGGRFIPHPATWLDQGRWHDEPTASIPTPLDRGPDPELERIKRDRRDAAPMPNFIKDLAAQLTGKAQA